MILAIDMGNTNIVVGGIDDHRIYFQERITTGSNKTDFEFAQSLNSVLQLNGIDVYDIDGAILSSVVPQNNAAIVSAVKKLTGCDCIVVKGSMDSGLTIARENPNEVGADLIVGCVAAAAQYPLPLAVIDMGTATTIFIVDRNLVFRGGIIHPGINVSLNSLSSSTAQLPQIDLSVTGSVIGTNTVDCMRSGVLYGHAGMIDSILVRMEFELGEPLTVIATGGLARFVVPLCGHEIIVDDDLLVKGLRILYKRSTGEASSAE